MASIVVLGSHNTDLVIKSDSLPRPGETVLGGEFFKNPGGKGANQAVAAAKLGAHVTFIARLGNDVFGKEALTELGRYGISAEAISIDEKAASGIALILVDAQGENSISVALGANNNLSMEDVDLRASNIGEASHLLAQLESPYATVAHAFKLAKQHSTTTVLNPAPAPKENISDMLKYVDIITPNQAETEALTGIFPEDIENAEHAAHKLQALGVETVIITMGKKGALMCHSGLSLHIPAEQVTAIDTTAAGDTFNGALVTSLAQGSSLEDAVRFANKAAAFSVTRLGAQASSPTLQDLNLS